MRRVKETVHYFCNDILFGHIDGHGVTTAVLDTGISPHPDLKGRIVAFGDMLYGKRRWEVGGCVGTQGAGFGAAFAIIVLGAGIQSSGSAAGGLTFTSPVTISLCAFVCSMAVSLLILALSRLRSVSAEAMVLAGVALSLSLIHI